MEGFTTKDAWDHLRSEDAQPEESYAVKLRNDHNIVEVTGLTRDHYPTGRRGALHSVHIHVILRNIETYTEALI